MRLEPRAGPSLQIVVAALVLCLAITSVIGGLAALTSLSAGALAGLLR